MIRFAPPGKFVAIISGVRAVSDEGRWLPFYAVQPSCGHTTAVAVPRYQFVVIRGAGFCEHCMGIEP